MLNDIKKSVFSIVILTTCAFSAEARVYDLPAGCEYGRTEVFDYNTDNLQAGLEAGYNIYTDPQANSQDQNAWRSIFYAVKDLIDGYDYLRVETAKFVLQGETFRTKANLFDTFANVRFNNSELGYIGTDKSNIEANSYHYMSFPRTYGAGLVWVNRASGMCSAEMVWVQKMPTIEMVSLEYGQAIVKYSVDKFSKAAKDSTQKVILKLTGVAQEGSKIVHYPLKIDSINGTVALNFASDYRGTNFHVYASVDDGIYSKRVFLGTVTGGTGNHRPCPSCETDI
jgi:hypothetical protein